ncbi:hypothetical protein GRF29_1g3585581 [Pseudopithomyces chartarum]|uniref:NAD(P)-binding protein n=1 Tax=Pseudopithomyces chartarum TaxID=1892770 RepID=A0AAN6RN59_9PLEO|nr:hypothetical protein GRF29_1g3585581 [Pseudopithomyces chartarum]
MVPLPTIRAHNATLSSLPPNLVAVFVGGTSGISHYTALSLARSVPSPKIYLIGRNAAEASKITSELKAINPSSTISFIKSDVSLLRNVDKVCDEIKAKEKEVNLLFMTAGYLSLQGRTETEEGLDRRFALHYYARARFIHNLSPSSPPPPLPPPHPSPASSPSTTQTSVTPPRSTSQTPRSRRRSV